MATNIIHTLQSLEKITSSYDKRREIDKLREVKGEYVVTTTAIEIERNYSYVREDGYRDGYGFLGALEGIDSELKILLPTSLNEEAESWSGGEEHSFTVRFLDWDSSYKHYKLLATGILSIPTPGPNSTGSLKTHTPTRSEPTPPKSESVLKSKIPFNAETDGQEPPQPKPIAKQSIQSNDRQKARKTRTRPRRSEPKKEGLTPRAAQVNSLKSGRKTEGASTPANTPELNQTQMPAKPEARAYTPAPVSLSKYAPPTLQKVPVLERVKTFGSGNKPVMSSRYSQQVTDKTTSPFQLIQGEYKKPLILGLKIFGGLFAAFLLLTCICCGAMT
ncbi:hypothetical protein OAI33_11020 [Pirellulaceae bacterium]|nr:hypothetical protein [Pirellulaceae bacterium]